MTRNRILTLLLLFTIGLAGRLYCAHEVHGQQGDLKILRAWAKSVAMVGPTQLYGDRIRRGTFLYEYPPAWCYAAWAVTQFAPELKGRERPSPFLVKLIPALADTLCAALLLALGWVAHSYRAGLVASAWYLLDPAVLFIGPIWCQTGVLYWTPLVAGAIALWFRSYFCFGICLAFSILGKQQAVMAFPVLLLGLCLVGRGKGVLKAFAGGLVGVSLVYAPFVIQGTIGEALAIWSLTPHFDDVSTGAYNLWFPFRMLGGGMYTVPATTPGLFEIPYRTWGVFLYSVALIGLIAFSWRKLWDLSSLLIVTSISILLFFLLNTDMHERYAVGGIPLLIAALAVEPRTPFLRTALVFYSAAAFANLLSIILWSESFFRFMERGGGFLSLGGYLLALPFMILSVKTARPTFDLTLHNGDSKP